MNLRVFAFIIAFGCGAGCGAHLIMHNTAFTSSELLAGGLSLGGVSSMGGGIVAEEEVLQEEVLRQFHSYWSNLIVLPTQYVDECAGSSQRQRLMKSFAENTIVESRDLELVRPCMVRGRFILLLNLENLSEKRSESSSEDRFPAQDKGDEVTVWKRRVRLRVRIRAAIYDLQTGLAVWEAAASDSSSNAEQSYHHLNNWPKRPDVESAFRGALFQLEHRLTHDLSGPHIPWIAIDREVQP